MFIFKTIESYICYLIKEEELFIHLIFNIYLKKHFHYSQNQKLVTCYGL